MIKVEGLSYGYPQKELYSDISFSLEMGQHCAFIGISGSGKSSLVDIMMHPEQYMYTGKMLIPEQTRFGYVSQFCRVQDEKEVTVFDYIAEEFIKGQQEIDVLCEELGSTADMEGTLEKYQVALDAFDAIDGNNYESNILKQLQLSDLAKQKDNLLSEISGGEFKLVQIIREMLVKPDVLIMDEPDVFLDFEHLNILRELINSYKGTLLVITHNRFLLNHCFNKILHLENKGLQEFDGTYIEYHYSLLVNKVEVQEIALKQAEEIARNEVIIEQYRARAAYDADAVRGRALGARVKIHERLLANQIQEPFLNLHQPKIYLNTTNSIEAETIVEVKDYEISFDEVLLEEVSFEIGPNDKVAIIGGNGTGKTTLLRAIYENSNSKIAIDDKVEMAYLSQKQGEMLTESNTVFDEFFEIGFETYDQIRDHLKQYHLEGELLEQPISNLSGGEKNLLQLAKISAQNANFLLFDEPTSHLDTYAQQALEQAIQNYNGAVLMVSHDFYTVANCVDYILRIDGNTVSKSKLKKFKQKVYAKYFDKSYLELEESKKAIEIRIEEALCRKDYEKAKELCESLESIIEKM